MKVTLLNITDNPIDTIYMGYRICYSKNVSSIFLAKHEGYEAKRDFILPLIKEGHSSPFEHVSATFLIEGISRACLSQLTRHRTMKFNVQSQRYINANNFGFSMPNLSYIDNMADRLDIENELVDTFSYLMTRYEKLMNMGLKKEDARHILPMGTTCNLIVTVDMNNFRKFLTQRLCNSAQKEIRELARTMRDLVVPHIPFIDNGVMNCGVVCTKCLNQ